MIVSRSKKRNGGVGQMLKIEIKTGNAAYSENDELTWDGRFNLAANLKVIANMIVNGENGGTIMDINGNKVGKWEVN